MVRLNQLLLVLSDLISDDGRHEYVEDAFEFVVVADPSVEADELGLLFVLGGVQVDRPQKACDQPDDRSVGLQCLHRDHLFLLVLIDTILLVDDEGEEDVQEDLQNNQDDGAKCVAVVQASNCRYYHDKSRGVDGIVVGVSYAEGYHDYEAEDEKDLRHVCGYLGHGFE